MIDLCDYSISSEAFGVIEEESDRKFPLETGGILIGWKDTKTFAIEIAVGPGPKAFHRRNIFKRDGCKKRRMANTLNGACRTG